MMLRAAALAAIAALPVAAEDFRVFEGHGGPVMDVSVSGDMILTSSFDNSVGVWRDGAAPVWLNGHEAAVNVAISVPGERAASGGDDFAVILWDLASGEAIARFQGHQGKVMGLATTADGALLASASWDGTLRLWDMSTGEARAILDGHDAGVNDVVFSADGQRLYSAGADGVVIEWDVPTMTRIRDIARHGFGVNVLALDDDGGWLAYGAVDGGTRVVHLSTGATLADLTADRRPILGLARAPDGSRIAVGDGEGHIMVVRTDGWRIEHDFRAALNGPIWALDFTETGGAVIAGGIADEAMLWPLDATDDAPRLAEAARAFHVDPETVENGERQFLRKCSVCHTLTPDSARKAGPTLYGLFGRDAGSVDGYIYSDAVRDAGIVWTEDTIDALFDIGPEQYIPGTKMPMQRITAPEDRADLIEFLKRETRPE